MKKVLFVISTLRMAGAEKSLISLLKALDPQRIKADLFVFESGGELEKEVPEWVNIIKPDVVTTAMTLEIRRYFIKLLKKGKIFAAIARLRTTADSSLNSKFGTKAKYSWNTIKKYIPALSGHYDVAVGYLEDYSNNYVIDKVNADRKIGWIHIDMTGKTILKEQIYYYNLFDKIATISDVCLEAACDALPGIENKIEIIENIVLKEDVINKSNDDLDCLWKKDCVNIVSVGRLEFQKGMDIAAKACKVLKDKGLSVCWHIYGKGSMQEDIDTYIKDNKLEDDFILEGVTPNPYPYIKKADIFVQPSRWEGKSIALDEAKILGKAIVVTNYPSVSDQITNEVTGLITDITPEAIADGIERLINDNNLRSQLEVNCSNEPNQSIIALNKFYKMIEA